MRKKRRGTGFKAMMTMLAVAALDGAVSGFATLVAVPGAEMHPKGLLFVATIGALKGIHTLLKKSPLEPASVDKE